MAMKRPTAWLMFLCALLLSACAQLGLEKPQSLDDQIQYGKAALTASYRTLGDQVAAKTISAQKASTVFARLEAIEKSVQVADDLRINGKPQDALQTITLALNALTLIRNELKGTP